MNKITVTIPAKALRISGGMSAAGSDEGITPEVNDPVSFHAEGVVTSKTGESCIVEIRFINGERPSEAKAEMAPKDDGEISEEELAEAAAKADSESL